MARLTRKNIKVFAGNATNNGVFGSLQAENPVTTTNVEQIQSLPAWSVGWNSATMTSEKLPPLEEFQGIQYVTTYQQAYLMQEGMPEWASTVTYYKGSLAKEVTSNGFRIYCSLTDDNTNHLLSDTSNWKKIMDSSDLYAYDSAVVHIAGTEIITGSKTFTQNVVRANTNITKGTNPSSKTYCSVELTDKNGEGTKNRVGIFESAINTNGDIETLIGAYKYDNNSTTVEKISVIYPKTGNPYTFAPTPTLNSSASGYSGQIATVGWIDGSNSNLVHRTGNETVAGTKTFTSDPYIKNTSPFLYLDDTAQTKGTAPSADVWGAVTFHDANGNLMGRCRQLYAADKSNKVELQVHKANSSSDTDSATMGIKYPASGSAYGYAPNSDVNGSILTTVSCRKGTSSSDDGVGYVRFGNGLIIQWGRVTGITTNKESTVTFPTAFTSATSYTIVKNYQSNAQSEAADREVSFYSMTATSAKTFTASTDTNSFSWIAIGY